MTVTSAGQAINGSVALTKDRKSVQFTPARNFIGTGSFNYTVSDGHGGTATASVTVAVTK